MTKSKEVSTGYSPRKHQAELHANMKRFNVIVCHRRFGKTHCAINEVLDRGLRLYTSGKLKMPRYAYIAPTYGQAKKIAWDIVKSYSRNIPGCSINENELRVDFDLLRDPTNTMRIQLLGAENPDSLRGLYLDGVVLDEFASMQPSVWSDVVRPALSDRMGWAIFIGTPKGRNAFYDLHNLAKTTPGWFTDIYPASKTKIIPQEELDAMKAEMGDDTYEQELECSFTASVSGTYYGKEIAAVESNGRICSVPFDPGLGTITAWDLGIGDSLAIWFVQRLFREVRVIDYMEVDGLGIPDISKRLKEKPYIYTTHLLPHDAAARELGTGVARVQTLQQHGIRGTVLPRLSVDDGIQAARNLLAMCWFDAVNCARGLLCLREYRRDWDDKTQMFKNKPLHNQYSHGADAFRYLAIGIDKERPLIEPSRPDRAILDYDELGGRDYGRRQASYERD